MQWTDGSSTSCDKLLAVEIPKALANANTLCLPVLVHLAPNLGLLGLLSNGAVSVSHVI